MALNEVSFISFLILSWSAEVDSTFTCILFSDVDGTPNVLTSSVIYKLSDGDFVPFQSFKLEAVSRWEAYSVSSIIFRAEELFFFISACLYWFVVKMCF